jgi:hypothetical protein
MTAKLNVEQGIAASMTRIPPSSWSEFLEAFSRCHRHWLVSLATHDLETNENVATRYMPLQAIELDLEDTRNTRINVIVEMDNKVIKHILFRPTSLTLHVSATGSDESLQIHSINTMTTIRFRSAANGPTVDERV